MYIYIQYISVSFWHPASGGAQPFWSCVNPPRHPGSKCKCGVAVSKWPLIYSTVGLFYAIYCNICIYILKCSSSWYGKCCEVGFIFSRACVGTVIAVMDTSCIFYSRLLGIWLYNLICLCPCVNSVLKKPAFCVFFLLQIHSFQIQIPLLKNQPNYICQSDSLFMFV